MGKFLKRLGITIVIIVILVLLGFWSPWNNWKVNMFSLLGIEQTDSFASLKVKSLSGEVEIFVDNELMGTANADDADFSEITPVEVGEHLITLRKKEAQDKYYVMSKKLNFEPGVDVVIAYDLGPTEAFSEGHILNSRKNFTLSDDVYLNIAANPTETEVYIDDNLIGSAPLNNIKLDNSKQHKLKFIKKGFDTLEITILPEKQEDRDKLNGLTLDLEVNLFTQPIKVINVEQ